MGREPGSVVVSGLPRSGTSWVGKMLEAGGRHVYVNEPLNPSHPPGRSPGVLNAEVQHYFQYVCVDNADTWEAAFERTLALRYGLMAEVRANHGLYDLARAARYLTSFTTGRMTGKRALIDDPYAIFTVPWLVERFGLSAVVMIRDPVAFVGSWRALGWQVDTNELLDQPLLMRDLLGPYREELADVAGSADWLGSAAALWRAAYGALHSLVDHPRLNIVRHEQLVTDPMGGFSSLYDRLSIPWTSSAMEAVRRATSDSDKGGEKPFSWNLSSGISRTAYRPMSRDSALGSYRDRLTETEIARVRELTDDVRGLYYPRAHQLPDGAG